MGLHVAQVVPYFHPHVGGVESHVESVSRELVQRGHRVTVATSEQPEMPAWETWEGIEVVRLPELANLWNTPVTRGIGDALDAADPDLVHSHWPPPLASLAAARWRATRGTVPHVFTYHCDLDLPQRGGSMVVDLYRRTLGRYTLDRTDHIVATTRSYAETSRSLWRRDGVHVIPNPVDAHRFHPGVDGTPLRRRWGLTDEVVALFVGRLAPHKGVDNFIRAAAHTGPRVRHIIVGDGPQRGRLEALARRTDGGHKVRFAGRVPEEELPATYRAADLGVLPSTSRLEAFGIAALECMASARPVVVSDIPGVTEVIEEAGTGLLAEPLDPRSLAARIQELAEDAARRRSMGKRARERVLDRFTSESVVDALLEVYGEALEG